MSGEPLVDTFDIPARHGDVDEPLDPMWRPRVHVQFGGNAGLVESSGEFDGVVTEPVDVPDTYVRRREASEVGGPRWSRVVGDVWAAVQVAEV
jgi:hypothetical protein